jgi:molecular chaperone Hsp33
MRWYENSEQLDTIIVCAAEKRVDGWQAVALMLQKIAVNGGKGEGASAPKTNEQDRAASDDAWHTAKTLLGSITRGELLDPALLPEDIIFRLFNSMAPHSAPARPVLDQCRCNVEKIESMLQQLAPDAIDDMSDHDGNLTVTCEFCKTTRAYHKDAIPRP